MISHKWLPIQPAETDSEQYDFSELNSLHQQWINIRDQRENLTPEAYKSFLDRIGRSWAIETGIIEGIFALDRGITETLVEKGIVAEYIERSSTDRDPHELVRILKDHQDSIEFIYQQIKSGRPLSKQFIRELHIILTRSQPTFQAVDQFGNEFDTLLDRGGFKKLPNNPTRPDGGLHEYCPPLQVDSELDNLLYLYDEYQQNRNAYHPLLTGAWLHHRFTQIHPFQDGNGRVARALLMWHLVKEEFLPVVISRDDRDSYIDALESADRGELVRFVDLTVQLEKQTILQALGEPEPFTETGLVDQVVDHIVDLVKRQNQRQQQQLRSVDGVAATLRRAVETELSTKAEEIGSRLGNAGMPLRHSLDRGGPGEKEHWYRVQVIETANRARHWANFNESRFFFKLSLNPEAPSRNPRLVFVISLHHIGNQLTGIMAATAFAQIEHYLEDNTDTSEESVGSYFKDCTVNAFTFTWEDDAATILPRFIKWAEECLSIGLSYWTEYLT